MIRTNAEKFNVSSVYDENMTEYTVPVPECDEATKRKATLLAEDIENKTTTNIHVAEERGQIIPHEIGEEDRCVSIRLYLIWVYLTGGTSGKTGVCPVFVNQVIPYMGIP